MYHNKAVTTYVGTNLCILQGLNKAAFVWIGGSYGRCKFSEGIGC